MYLCVNANAAIDKTVVVRRFELNRIHRPERVILLPGGKGINVARSLHTLDEKAAVTGWAGGFAGQFIAARLVEEGIRAEFAWCNFESRSCMSVVDPEGGTLTELYETGEPVPPAQVDELKLLFTHLLAQVEFVTISGSLPLGVPASFYAELVLLARQAGVPAALDCSGEALRLGLEACPALVKPNQAEFQSLVGRPLAGLGALTAAARETARRCGSLIVLSLGVDGAIAVRGEEAWHAIPPKVKIASAVGSGDALLAGVVQGLGHGMALPDALRRGVAAGTANALSVGAAQFTRTEFEKVLPGVEVRSIL